ncbi:MAG TPA: NifU family protein [Alphaproteobacteria bacterium]|nr:NifU family protein [Alphaproteobacteria bacterium]
MFIETEQTPNPATLKFLPGRAVLESGSVDFATAAEAARSPLAERLFQVEGVVRVFLGSDFISVTKATEKEWFVMKPALLGVIMEHFIAGSPVLLREEDAQSEDDSENGPQAEIIAQIKELLDTRVRPAVAQDGGDITFRSFQDGVVYLNMRGACSGCPSSTATLKMGIENMLRHYIPEVREVRPVQ